MHRPRQERGRSRGRALRSPVISATARAHFAGGGVMPQIEPFAHDHCGNSGRGGRDRRLVGFAFIEDESRGPAARSPDASVRRQRSSRGAVRQRYWPCVLAVLSVAIRLQVFPLSMSSRPRNITPNGTQEKGSALKEISKAVGRPCADLGARAGLLLPGRSLCRIQTDRCRSRVVEILRPPVRQNILPRASASVPSGKGPVGRFRHSYR